MTKHRSCAQSQYQIFRGLLKAMETNTIEGKTARAIREELTPRQRQMVELYYLRQHTMQEIGSMLGVCPSTVCRTLQAARRNLRRCLKYGGRRLLSDEYDDEE